VLPGFDEPSSEVHIGQDLWTTDQLPTTNHKRHIIIISASLSVNIASVSAYLTDLFHLLMTHLHSSLILAPKFTGIGQQLLKLSLKAGGIPLMQHNII